MESPQLLTNDATLLRYRRLLDAEDAAFDLLEHHIEDGDRSGYTEAFVSWQQAHDQREAFLGRSSALTL